MSGLAIPGARLGAESVEISPGVEWDGRGLRIADTVTGEQWAEIVLRLLDLHDRLKWAIGDALSWGELHRPEAFDAIFDHDTLGDRYETVASWIRVASRIPPERRRPSISWSAHRAVSHLPPKERDAWLDRAEAEGLGSNALEAELRGHRPPRREQIIEAATAVWISSRKDGDTYVTPGAVMTQLGTLLDGEARNIEITHVVAAPKNPQRAIHTSAMFDLLESRLGEVVSTDELVRVGIPLVDPAKAYRAWMRTVGHPWSPGGQPRYIEDALRVGARSVCTNSLRQLSKRTNPPLIERLESGYRMMK